MAMTADRASAIRHIMTRALGIVATATVMLSLAPAAQALSLSNPGTAPAARQARDALTTQVRGHGGRGGGGGFHGGGFRGGGFRPAAPVFRGGGFHRPALAGGGFRRGPAFHGGGIRYGGPAFVRRGIYAPAYYYGHRRHFHRHRYFGPRYYGYAPRYYGPRRFCRVIWTYYGPRKICRYRPWHHHNWHYRRHFNVYW